MSVLSCLDLFIYSDDRGVTMKRVEHTEREHSLFPLLTITFAYLSHEVIP